MTTKISEANIQSATLEIIGGGPKIASVTVTNSSYATTSATAVPPTGGYVKITGTGFVSGVQVLVDETPATSVTFVDSTTLQVAVPATAVGTYFVYVVNPDGGYTIAVNGLTYQLFAPATVEYLIIAGGGGGGGHFGGGGGAGGLLSGTTAVTASTQYTVTVGAGGTAGPTYPSTDRGGDGSLSLFSAFATTAVGGGGGGTRQLSNSAWVGKNGGSGGGGGNEGGTTAGTGTAGQGNNGGVGFNSGGASGGGGGGGAGGVGGDGGSSTGGIAGIGSSSSISGAAVTYALGGGGASASVRGTAGSGINTGGGGAGSQASVGGDAGSSGVVIVRYADTYNVATATTGSPTVTVAGGYRVYKFTTSGSITF